MTILCPECGEKPRYTTTKYGLRLDHCGLWAWGEYPLVDEDTHSARKAAHAAFDRLWRLGFMRRGDAYGLLAQHLGMTRDECHIKQMTAEQARKVVEFANRYLGDTGHD